MIPKCLQGVLQALPVILLAWTAHGIVTRAQGRGLQLLNTTPEHLRGHSVFALVQDAPDIQAYIHHALSGEAFTAIVTFRERIFETYYRPCTETASHPRHVLCIALDITEHTRLRAHVLNRFTPCSHSHTAVLNPEQPIEAAGDQRETVAEPPYAELSPRQRAILRAAASGMNTADIARHLGLQPSTVKWYFAQIYQQLGVPNRTAAMWYAREHKLLD